jgi:hypothetical protein
LTWQDELRQLDEELAAGRISADDYRVRRDHVLAAAASPMPVQKEPEAKQPESGENPTVTPPVPPVQANPQHPLEGDRTQQVTPGWTVGPKDNDVDRTQVVPGAAGYGSMNPPPPGYPQHGPNPMVSRPVPPWDDDRLPPQWSGQDLPPSWGGGEFGHGGEAWLKQGPEVFEGGRSNTGKIVAIVAAVVVLIGVAIGAYFIWGRDSGGTASPPQTNTATSTATTTKPPDPMAIAELPGVAQPKEVSRFSDVTALNYLTQAETATYQQAKPTKAAVRVSQLNNGTIVVVLVVQTASPEAAKTAVDALVEHQLTNKATKVQGPESNVTVTRFEGQLRAHYQHGNVVVRVEVKNADAAKAGADLERVLRAQLEVSAADG